MSKIVFRHMQLLGVFYPRSGPIGMAPIALLGENICLTLENLFVLAKAVCGINVASGGQKPFHSEKISLKS